ncbi:LLM class flavin-dependent oxidoreductase [Conexibacter arvalis]|uniref:Alkanesulfonate monooxygenase n=1 Tax=Conexibacter arvalis TaxID=912552 RepID=A0A840I9S1_9ACTN|nr:alkanesulfonate monooxygenase [Conexibacter arvalis]
MSTLGTNSGTRGDAALRVFSTTPQSKDLGPEEYARRVADVARWSEEAGCEGILVYTDNGIVDPWLVSQLILQSTERLCPLVAVQPVYMHPYSVAKMVTSLAYLHNRRVWLNMLAGGFKNDLVALGDETPHDERYARTTEYTRIVLELLRGERPVSLDGAYYHVSNLKLTPPLPPELMPGVLVSGSSPAGLAAAEALDATPVKYPHPPGEEEPSDGREFGVRIGIVARDSEEEAWRVALERFPEDRAGQITQKLAMQVSDSHWHKQLSQRLDGDGARRSPYWLGPFQNYRTFCPYLVGDHGTVADLVAGYRAIGASTIILDIPPSREELEQIEHVLALAQARERS